MLHHTTVVWLRADAEYLNLMAVASTKQTEAGEVNRKEIKTDIAM